MGKIRVLSDQVASQVAAGEVIERPASLVKELVENSLDAGATRIWVEFARGGSRLVSVRDDGSGMDREDALLCLERHATSKIRSAGDLALVRSMGFRGEALPSIASVSHFRLLTREPSADVGTEVIVSGGRVESVHETGAPAGTQIEVRDLFFNLPARRKFLRGEETEAAHIIHGLQAVALANPSVAFECRRDGRTVLSYPRAENLAVRIRDVLGADHLARLTEITPFEGEGFRLSGFLARPRQGRRDRLHQFVIMNGRPIACPAVQQPLREAYADALERGSHPICVLSVDMDPQLVDTNVHPAKREVRLRQPEALRRAVFEAARAALTPTRERTAPPAPPAPARQIFTPQKIQQSLVLEARAPAAPIPPAPSREVSPLPSREPVGAARPPAPVEPPAPVQPQPGAPARISPPAPAEPPPDRYRFLGSLEGGYLVLEGDEGLVLVDASAAGERILFENLMRQIEEGEVSSQRLLIPAIVELPPREHAWVADHLDDLRASGFLVEPFGGSSLKIEGLPASAPDRDAGALLHDIASALRAAGKLSRGRAVREALVRSVCRLAASERTLVDEPRALRLIAGLLRCELPYASPSGRPTMIQFSFAELARKFGRPT